MFRLEECFLDRNQKDRDGFEGRLPASAPLANPYVPFQSENPPKYEARKGLIRGTLFQGLDLPFMGMVNNKEKPVTPLSELQVLGFALQEMALYLDTHRDDKEALELYRAYQEIYHRGMMEYEENCCAMAHGMPSNRDTYAWLDDPWPWEYAKN
jgi:spore coat protein JB